MTILKIQEFFLGFFALILEYLLIAKNRVNKRRIPKQWMSGNKGNLILIVGLHENINFLFTLGQIINQSGYRVHLIEKLGNNTMPLIQGYTVVKKYIDDHQLKNFVVLAHSKGGLIGKMLLDKLGKEYNIQALITIATPFGGSWLAWLFPSARELLPGSKIIQSINNQESSNNLIHNFYPTLDNHVIPNRNLLLHGGRNIKINIIGHTRILEAKQTKESVKKILHTLATVD